MHWCVYDEQHWEHTEFIYKVIQQKADLRVALLRDVVNLKANTGSRGDKFTKEKGTVTY